MGYRIGIAGASGYGGGELVRLIDNHPEMDAVYLAAGSNVGKTLGEVHPQLRDGDRGLQPLNPAAMADLDLAFLALPHGASATPAMELIGEGVKVVDLGSDFRLHDAATYRDAYGDDHPHVDQLGEWAYGIPELFADDIAGSDRIAAPGCYPTATVLAVAPLVSAGVIGPDVVVSALSGVSGAGRSSSAGLSFGAVDEGVRPYMVGEHRHRPEMEQAISEFSGLDATVVFTPHLVPMQRGLLATCHGSTAGTAVEAFAVLRDAYASSPFVDVLDTLPQTRWVVGSNRCHIAVRVDRTGTLIVMSAIDNLLKGASGQAIQCANLMLGLDETAGLPFEGWMP